jgi:hypothetical protein
MKRICIFCMVLLAATTAISDGLGFTTTNTDYQLRMVDYYDANVSTVHPTDPWDYPWAWTFNDSTGEAGGSWTGDATNKPTEAQFLAADPVRGKAIRDNTQNDALHGAGSSDVRDTAASNIVALADTYGVTEQPVSWADVAAAIQLERADATASNDVMRLLTVIGDGTAMLSYKEFYSENGGDVFDVTWP